MSWRKRWPLGVWLLFFAACVAIIGRTEFNTDMSAFLPRSPTPMQQVLVDQLRDGVVSRMMLVGLDSAPPAELARISKAMVAQLRSQRIFTSVSNGESVAGQQDYQFLWRNRFLLSPAVTPEHYSVAGLRQSLQDDLGQLASPVGPLVQRMLPGDPGGEMLGLLDQVQGQANISQFDGVWFSGDGRRAMLLLQTRTSGSNLDGQEQAQQAVERAFASAREETASARLQLAGPGVFAVQSRASIRDDALRYSTIAMLLVASLLLLLYRSPRALALGLLPVASGAMAGVAAVSLGFGSVHGITLGFGVTLIGECVDYAIYLFTQIPPGDTPRNSLQRIWPTLRLGVFTSICGFSAMLFSGFTGLAQLGLFSIAGLVVAVMTTRWVLPLLLPAGFHVRADERLLAGIMSVVRIAPRARIVLLLGLAGLLAAGLARHDGLWNDNLGSLSPVPQALQDMDADLRHDLGAPDVRHMIIATAADQQQALQRSEHIAAKLREQVNAGALEGFDYPALYLPSIRAQQARLAALPDETTLRRNLLQAQRGLPFRPGLFELFLRDLQQARQQPLITAQTLQGSSLGLKLDALLLKRAGGWTAIMPLRGVADANVLARELKLGAGAYLLDMKQEAGKMLLDYRHEAASHAMYGIAAILLLLLANLRSLLRVLEVALPLAAAVLVTALTLVWSGHALTLFHLVGLLLVVAVGSNYALFFVRPEAYPGERQRVTASLVFANLSTMIGFGLLAFSHAPVLAAIGGTVALGTMLSLVFSAILIKK